MMGAEFSLEEVWAKKESAPNGIYPLDVRHAARIVELNRAGLGEWSRLSIYSATGIELHFRRLLIESTQNGYHYYGFFHDGLLVGYIEWRVLGGNVWFLNNMDVAADAQGLGIGGKLVAHGLSLAETLGMDRAALDVYQSNTRVLAWYESFGFVCGDSAYIYEFTPQTVSKRQRCEISNLYEAAAKYNECGYTMLEIDGEKTQHSVGVPNPYYFVVREVEEAEDAELADAVLEAFPGRRGLLFSETEVDAAPFEKVECLVRMERPF